MVVADKLAAIGIEENEKNLAKKISRGGFKAAFLFQCLEAIGCESLHLRHITLTLRPTCRGLITPLQVSHHRDRG